MSELMKAMKRKCLQCAQGQKCNDNSCPLYKYVFGSVERQRRKKMRERNQNVVFHEKLFIR